MPKFFTSKSLQNSQSKSSTKKEKVDSNLKPSQHVLRYLMAYSTAIEIVDCASYGEHCLFLN